MVQMRPNAWAVEEFFLISTQAVENDLFNVNFVGKMKSMRQIDVNLCRVCVCVGRESERERAVHPWIHLIICVLDGDGVSKLVRGDEIQVPFDSHRSVGVWTEPKAYGLSLHS